MIVRFDNAALCFMMCVLNLTELVNVALWELVMHELLVYKHVIHSHTSETHQRVQYTLINVFHEHHF